MPLLPSLHCCLAHQNLRKKLHPPRRLQREPIVQPEHPWEAKGVYHQGSVLKDDRWPVPFRMWYSAIGERRREQQYLGYAESPDGQHFTKPMREAWGFGDWRATNILYGQHFNISAPNVHFYHQPRGGYRYFLTFDSRIEQHQFRHVPITTGLTAADVERLKRHPNYTDDFDWSKYYPPNTGSGRATYLADSADGLTWEPADARYCIPGASDGDHVVVYDPQREYYRMYLRDNRIDENGHRIRQVVTATSPDTIEWTRPQLCLESDAIDDPRVNQIHGMCVTYRDGLFIGLIQVMHIEEEVVKWHPLQPFERARFHVQLAASHDGIHFHRVADRGEYFDTGEPGAFDEGMVRCGGQIVIDGDRMLMYYDGRPYEHAPKSEAAAGDGCTLDVGIGVAEAPLDRFAGLTPRDADRPAHAVAALPANAAALTLNCDVPSDSAITCSLRYPDGCRVPGYTDDEAAPLREGGLRVPLRWQAGEQLPRNLGPLHLRLTLTGGAVVYAMNV